MRLFIKPARSIVLGLLILFAAGPAAALEAGSRSILVLGDSLSAAYGMPAHEGWVQLLGERLATAAPAYRVVNASITGDTTRGGLSRLPAALERENPAIVIIELGGNDGLRGFKLEHTRENLARMIALSRAHGARVLLLGIRLPANYGKAYGDKFHRIYLELAARENVALVPFFLAGVAETRALMQPDGIHPGAAAQPRILDNVWEQLEPLLGLSSGVPAGPVLPEQARAGQSAAAALMLTGFY
jgi:acyl-CoA thioesterase-1